MITWAEIGDLMATEHGGVLLHPHGGYQRRWQVPTGDGGSFALEITLRAQWCTVSIDRYRTTDRDELACDWIERNVGRYARRAGQRCRDGRAMWSAGPGFASAYPIDRAELLELLGLWVGQEKAWAGVEATL